MLPTIEFPVPQELKARGVEKITKEKDTLVVVYDRKPIRFDIETKWLKTIMNFEKSTKGLLKDASLIQAIIFCISASWQDITEGNFTCSGNGLITKSDPNFSDNMQQKKTTGSTYPHQDERDIQSNSGKGVGGTEVVQNNNSDNESVQTVDPTKDLDPYVEAQDYPEFVISIIKKTVKREDATIRQVFYTSLSKDTRNPLNLAILAPTSEGKTYLVQQTVSYFPKEKVWIIGSMSPKVIIRQNGILVDKNNEPLKPVIKALKKEIREEKDKREGADKDKIEEVEDRIDELYKDARILIQLTGTLFVFLEPPHPDMWNILKPILSHDAYEIEHPYVEKIEGTGYTVKKIVTRGWPACIFCSAKDESKWPAWPEIQSRFLVTSPSMVSEKYLEANLLIGQKMGLPKLMQEALIVSSTQVEVAKKCVLYLNSEIQRLGAYTNNPVWIPFGRILSEILPSDKGTDNRTSKRIFSLLNIITLTRAHLRGRLVYGDDTLIISDLDDLDEVLHITQNTTGIPVYKLLLYKEVFLPLYSSKTQPNTDGSRQEKIIGVTTRELCDYFLDKRRRPITTNNMKETYLNELLNNGIIDSEDSILDKRQKIYYPIVDLHFEASSKDVYGLEIKDSLKSDRLDNILQHPTIMLPKNCRIIPNNWLEMEILDLIKCPASLDRFELHDQKDHLCICRFVKQYEKDRNLNGYFSKPNSYNYHNNLFGTIKYLDPNNAITSNKLSIQNQIDNIFNIQDGIAVEGESGKSNAVTVDNNGISSMKIVNDFFYDEPILAWKPLPDHSLEESPCYHIIEADMIQVSRQRYYRCKIHPEIWNINLESIEHHCKYKEPEKHKSEILRLMKSSGSN